MPNFSHMFRTKNLLRGLYGTGTLGATWNFVQRYDDKVTASHHFGLHTNIEQKDRYISGMHTPLIATAAQQSTFMRDYPQYKHLLPTSLDAFRRQQALKTAVQIK